MIRRTYPLFAASPASLNAGDERQGSLRLSLEGYNHKMKVLVERAVHRLTSFGDVLAREKDEEGQGDEVRTPPENIPCGMSGRTERLMVNGGE